MRPTTVLPFLALAFGCRSNEETLPASLISLMEEPPGANCAAGGVAIATGQDVNNDGVLGADEITQTEYACDAEAPPQSLIDVAVEPEGDNCAYGGTAVAVGPDTDGDGLLDAEEVTTTEYVCDPAPGEGALINVTEEPAGDNCAYGGLAVLTGFDADDDGALAGDEVTHTEYLCADDTTTMTVDEVPSESEDCAYGGFRVTTGRDTDSDGAIDIVFDEAVLCNGNPGTDGIASLVEVADEPPGSYCATGGLAITTGQDDDNDGVIDPSEVDDTTYVCDGADGASVLLSTADEAPGANCAEGGTRVDSGLDLDDNGILDSAEITQSAFVCDGLAGNDGTDATNALVSLVTESAGANCTTGGTAVQTGVDDNGNGTLDSSEIDATRYVCNGATGGTGTNALVATVAEAQGPNCANGGTKITSGTDANKNGALDSSEISTTSYVCNPFATTLPVLAYTVEGRYDISRAAAAGFVTVPDLDLSIELHGSYVVLTEIDMTVNPAGAGSWVGLRLNVDGNPDVRPTHAQPMSGGEESHLHLFRIDTLHAGTHRIKGEWGEGSGTMSNLPGNTSYAVAPWMRRMSVLAIPLDRGVKYGYTSSTTDVCRIGTTSASWADITGMTASYSLSAASTVLTMGDLNVVNSAGSNWQTYRMVVDGAGDPTSMSLQPIGGSIDEDVHASLFRVDSLASGNHTASMQWGYGSGTVCNNAASSLWTRRFGWLAIPDTTNTKFAYVAPTTTATRSAASGYSTVTGLSGSVTTSGGYSVLWTKSLMNAYSNTGGGFWYGFRNSVDGLPDAYATHTNPSDASEDSEVSNHRVDWVAPGAHTVVTQWGDGGQTVVSDATQVHWTRRLGAIAIPVAAAP